MSVTPVQELRRIAEAVAQLSGVTVEDVEVRQDCRQLRVTLTNGQLLLISVLVDDAGKARLDVDLLRTVDQVAQRQLEVRFEGIE
ncbi:MAG: hypothetical protein JSW43_13165 [Gemmatimonadota bacterium]|nr:MAG: hypothetical protein JSW43_13165 [Gemmatimonadota bacterium]